MVNVNEVNVKVNVNKVNDKVNDDKVNDKVNKVNDIWPLALDCFFRFWPPAVPAVFLPGCIWGVRVCCGFTAATVFLV